MLQSFAGFSVKSSFIFRVFMAQRRSRAARPPAGGAWPQPRLAHLYNAEVSPCRQVGIPGTRWDLRPLRSVSLVDSDFAKTSPRLREWYMLRTGRYLQRWAFGDFTPPFHAWAPGGV